MTTTLLRNLTEKDKNAAIKQLIEESTPRDDFFFMTGLSVIMATFGLLINNIAVVIGSMLIAPILSPILSISLGIVMADMKLIFRSFFTILKALVWSIPAAAIITWLFASQAGLEVHLNNSILNLTQPSVVFASIAFVAGLAASFALVKPQLSATIPGIAISVTLIPPIAVVGIGLATFSRVLMTDALVMFLVNVVSIVFASMIMFSLMNLYVKRPVAEQAIKKEDLVLKNEKEHAINEMKKEKEKNEMLKEMDQKLDEKRDIK